MQRERQAMPHVNRCFLAEKPSKFDSCPLYGTGGADGHFTLRGIPMSVGVGPSFGLHLWRAELGRYKSLVFEADAVEAFLHEFGRLAFPGRPSRQGSGQVLPLQGGGARCLTTPHNKPTFQPRVHAKTARPLASLRRRSIPGTRFHSPKQALHRIHVEHPGQRYLAAN
jgi:hypothetical protein